MLLLSAVRENPLPPWPDVPAPGMERGASARAELHGQHLKSEVECGICGRIEVADSVLRTVAGPPRDPEPIAMPSRPHHIRADGS